MSNEHSGNKYHRTIYPRYAGIAQPFLIDVYNVIQAFDVRCPARAHAIKKILCAGLRGKATERDDIAEAIDALTRALELRAGAVAPETPPGKEEGGRVFHKTLDHGRCRNCRHCPKCREAYPAEKAITLFNEHGDFVGFSCPACYGQSSDGKANGEKLVPTPAPEPEKERVVKQGSTDAICPRCNLPCRSGEMRPTFPWGSKVCADCQAAMEGEGKPDWAKVEVRDDPEADMAPKEEDPDGGDAIVRCAGCGEDYWRHEHHSCMERLDQGPGPKPDHCRQCGRERSWLDDGVLKCGWCDVYLKPGQPLPSEAVGYKPLLGRVRSGAPHPVPEPLEAAKKRWRDRMTKPVVEVTHEKGPTTYRCKNCKMVRGAVGTAMTCGIEPPFHDWEPVESAGVTVGEVGAPTRVTCQGSNTCKVDLTGQDCYWVDGKPMCVQCWVDYPCAAKSFSWGREPKEVKAPTATIRGAKPGAEYRCAVCGQDTGYFAYPNGACKTLANGMEVAHCWKKVEEAPAPPSSPGKVAGGCGNGCSCVKCQVEGK